MAQELLSLLGIGGGGLLTKEAYDTLGEVGDTAMAQSQQIGQQGADMANFTGYGVTGPTGQTTVGADGSTQYQLNPYQAAQMMQSGQAAMDFQNRAMGGGDHNEYYEMIRAMQMPEEQRAQSALTNTLHNQGRLGVTTNQYGGTPEQLAMEKALGESRNAAAVQAIDLARAQQAQDASISGMFGQQQYLPHAAMLNEAQAGGVNYGYEDVARRQAANMFSEAAMGGLDAKLGSRLGQANLMGNLGASAIQGGMGMMSQVVNKGDNFLEGLLDSIGLGDLFG